MPTKTKNPVADADVALLWERIQADPTSDAAATDVRRLVNAVRFARAGLVAVTRVNNDTLVCADPERDDGAYCGLGRHVEMCRTHCPARVAHEASTTVGKILAGELAHVD